MTRPSGRALKNLSNALPNVGKPLNETAQQLQILQAIANTVSRSISSSLQITPIRSLKPSLNGCWTIRARVTNKTSVQTYSRNCGKYFSCTLLDNSGEIKAIAFTTECNMFYQLLEVTKVYCISNAKVKQANKRFNSMNNDYEIIFNSHTHVELCIDDCKSVPKYNFNFVPITDLQKVSTNRFADVIGICKVYEDCQKIRTRNKHKYVEKRDITLVDQSLAEVKLTIWGDKAKLYHGYLGKVIAVKDVQVTDYNGISLSTRTSSHFLINPEISEAIELRVWYEEGGTTVPTKELSISSSFGAREVMNWKCLARVCVENLGSGEKSDYFSCKARVNMNDAEINIYRACPSAQCNKSVVNLRDGIYRCYKCRKDYPSYKWCIILKFSITDYSGSLWITCFTEAAEMILGATAKEIHQLKKCNEERRFNSFLQAATGKEFCFRLLCKKIMK